MAAEPGWRVLPPILPGADPTAALAQELAATARRVDLDWTVDQVHQRLDARGLAGLTDELLLADPDGPRRLLVVIDQFEELLTHTTPGRRAWFAELVSTALTGPVQVVGTVRARSAVEQAAVEWDGMGPPPVRLWGGGQLAAAVTNTGARTSAGSAPPPDRRGRSPRLSRRPRILITDRVDLSTTARDFLHAGIRRERSRRGRAVTVLSVLLILALLGTGVAVVAQREAQDRQRIATAGRLLGDAEAARSTDLRTALLLGLAAHRLDPGGRTHSSLVNTLAGGPYTGTLTGHTGWVVSVAFSPDGSRHTPDQQRPISPQRVVGDVLP